LLRARSLDAVTAPRQIGCAAGSKRPPSTGGDRREAELVLRWQETKLLVALKVGRKNHPLRPTARQAWSGYAACAELAAGRVDARAGLSIVGEAQSTRWLQSCRQTAYNSRANRHYANGFYQYYKVGVSIPTRGPVGLIKAAGSIEKKSPPGGAEAWRAVMLPGRGRFPGNESQSTNVP